MHITQFISAALTSIGDGFGYAFIYSDELEVLWLTLAGHYLVGEAVTGFLLLTAMLFVSRWHRA